MFIAFRTLPIRPTTLDANANDPSVLILPDGSTPYRLEELYPRPGKNIEDSP
jgi:hypothetical protein